MMISREHKITITAILLPILLSTISGVWFLASQNYSRQSDALLNHATIAQLKDVQHEIVQELHVLNGSVVSLQIEVAKIEAQKNLVHQ